MAINNISLRKLLMLFYLPPSKLTTELRKDIRQDIAKSGGNRSGGGDFHVPFWSDAKGHVAGGINLPDQTQIRIGDHSGRRRLYPLLMDGFLQWWNENRRWSNQRFEILPEAVKGQYLVSSLDAVMPPLLRGGMSRTY